MNFRKYLIPIGIACLFIASYNAWGWQGPITVLGGLVMWVRIPPLAVALFDGLVAEAFRDYWKSTRFQKLRFS